jgi:Predicted membrane protein
MFAVSLLLEQRVVVVEWWPRGLLAWLFLGLVAGWLAGKLSRGRGYGCITDIILGLIGSFIGGWLFTKLGIFGGGFIFSLAAATLGAVILVAIVHLFTGGSKS